MRQTETERLQEYRNHNRHVAKHKVSIPPASKEARLSEESAQFGQDAQLNSQDTAGTMALGQLPTGQAVLELQALVPPAP